MKKTSFAQKIILIIFGLFLCAVLLEVGLQIVRFTLLSLQEYRNKVSLKEKGTYRIMCLGESTTASGGRYSYPRQLEEVLNQQNIGIGFSAINKGVYGTDSCHILSRLKDNINRYEPDMVITMMGINDTLFDSVMPDKNTFTAKAAASLETFRTYRLMRHLWLSIVNKAREIGAYGLRTKEAKTVIEEAYMELAEHYGKTGKYARAVEMLKKAIEINPEDELAYIKLGGHYMSLEKYGKALKMFKKTKDINPKNDRVYALFGHYYRQREKNDEAKEIYEKGDGVRLEDSIIFINLGRCYKRKKKYAEAEEMLKKAIEINPEYDIPYVILAQCYEKWGKRKLAEEYFRKVNRIRLEYPNPITLRSYQRLKKIVTGKGIKLVCMQYPLRSIEPLKRMFEDKEGVIFVDNEGVFKEALKQAYYKEYFKDTFGEDFGHCTPKGNRLLAENIAKAILRECFNKQKN